MSAGAVVFGDVQLVLPDGLCERLAALAGGRLQLVGSVATVDGAVFAKKEQKAFKKAYKQEIVKRSAVMRIVAAWIVTVPATAVLAAVLFHIVRAVLA